MPVAVEQDQEHRAGFARLRLANAGGMDPASLHLRVTASQGGADRHLNPSRTGTGAWGTAEHWFRGVSSALPGPGLAVELGPSVTWHLHPFQPYAVAFRDASGRVVEDRMIWIDMRLPSNPPPPAPGSDPAPEPQHDGDPLAPFAAKEAAQEASHEQAADDPPPVHENQVARKRSVLWPAVAGVLLIAALGAGAWFFLLRDRQEDTPAATDPVAVKQPANEPASATASVPLTLEGARAYISQQKPRPGDALAEADRFTEAGQHQAAFLLNKYAAQMGEEQAQFRMARYYDPVSHDPALGVIPEPDPTIAADWYQQAAENAQTPAMLRLGELLKQGDVNWPDAPERAVFWLRKAAEAGSEKARELLQ